MPRTYRMCLILFCRQNIFIFPLIELFDAAKNEIIFLCQDSPFICFSFHNGSSRITPSCTSNIFMEVMPCMKRIFPNSHFLRICIKSLEPVSFNYIVSWYILWFEMNPPINSYRLNAARIPNKIYNLTSDAERSAMFLDSIRNLILSNVWTQARVKAIKWQSF